VGYILMSTPASVSNVCAVFTLMSSIRVGSTPATRFSSPHRSKLGSFFDDLPPFLRFRLPVVRSGVGVGSTSASGQLPHHGL
jgi:hypothetical protein